MSTRAVAARALVRIEDEGAYSNVVLPHLTADLSPTDRAFVYRLVMQALRRSRELAATIASASNRRLHSLDPEVRAVLQVATAELLGGARSHPYAAVNEAVEAARELGHERATRFVNGVLRRVAATGPLEDGSLGQMTSVPDWVVSQLSVDHADVAALLEGLRTEPQGAGIRVRPGGEAPEGAVAVPGIPDAWIAAGAPFPDPAISITDPASTAVGHAAAARAGDRVLDMAAAPGGKTLHLWDQLLGEGTLVAMDRHRRRLRSARRRLGKVGANPAWVLGDGRHAPFADSRFDIVVLDAPCTGLGTLRRRPEIAMRLQQGSPDRLGKLQHELLRQAWRLVRPGGRIVYSVCTLFAVESIDVVAGYPAAAPDGLPGRSWGKGLLLAPHLTGTDGMFISVLQRPR